jgi:hypothetical protein
MRVLIDECLPAGLKESVTTLGAEFQERVGIARGDQKIYVLISCPNSKSVYKSPVYEVGKAEQYIHPVDLGVINLGAGRQ